MTRLAACTGATQQRHDAVKPEPVVRTHATTGLVTVAHAKPMLAVANNVLVVVEEKMGTPTH